MPFGKFQDNNASGMSSFVPAELEARRAREYGYQMSLLLTSLSSLRPGDSLRLAIFFIGSQTRVKIIEQNLQSLHLKLFNLAGSL